MGGWFGTPMKSTGDSARNEGPPVSTGGGDTPITTASSSHRRLDALDSLRESTALTRQCFNDVDVAESPAKRIKMESKGKYDIDFPISPIPSTSSGLFQTNINHNFNIQNSEDYLNSGAGPSGLQNQRYAASSTMVQSSTTSTDVKANGAADDHSESSESTSGCSSLVPQSDRLSQSAYACTSRKKNLEEKLSYGKLSCFFFCEIYMCDFYMRMNRFYVLILNFSEAVKTVKSIFIFKSEHSSRK